jgi:hypothetical protein
MRTAALALLTSLVLAAPAAATAQPVTGTAPAFPFTDGRGVAVWLDPGGLRVWRDGSPLATAATLPTPAPERACRLGGVNARAAGWLCYESPAGDGFAHYALELEDLGTGALSEPPGDAAIRAETTLASELQSVTLGALGDATARFDEVGLHDDYVAVVRLDGGPRPAAYPPDGAVADYDTKAGYRRVCAPAPGRTDRLLYRAPWVLSLHLGRVYLRRCGSSTARLVGSTPTRAAVLTRRYAAWVNRDDDITVRMLATGKTYKFPGTPDWPRMHGTDQRLWLSDGRNPVRVIDLGS